MSGFIGREHELSMLSNLFGNLTANLVVVKGRRRVGKSRLIAEFAKDHPFYAFAGLAPRKGITAQDQRNEFARQLQEQLGLPGLKAEDWGDLFTLLARHLPAGRVIVLFDEISWMALDDPDFLGKLKIVWDGMLCGNKELVLVLCGSVSTWIEKNLLSSTGYLGRPTLNITLEELSLADCSDFWGANTVNISAYEKLKYLSVTGGIPRYLELMNPNWTADANIRNLCFNKSSPIFDEFERVFCDVYGNRNEQYQRIVELLIKGIADQETISGKLGIAQSGELSEYLNDLVTGGFLARDFTWNVITGKQSTLSHYRLKDNYTRFYLKFIKPNVARIERGLYNDMVMESLPGWYSVLGLQFENLVVNNYQTIFKILNIKPETIIFSNPFFQRATARQSGCQIDYLIQTRDTVYVCEIKFSRNVIGVDVIDEVQEKLRKLKLPKYMSRRAVLIHVNGVSDELIDRQFFVGIIDFGSLLHDQQV